jgi:hypothetical protein
MLVEVMGRSTMRGPYLPEKLFLNVYHIEGINLKRRKIKSPGTNPYYKVTMTTGTAFYVEKEDAEKLIDAAKKLVPNSNDD